MRDEAIVGGNRGFILTFFAVFEVVDFSSRNRDPHYRFLVLMRRIANGPPYHRSGHGRLSLLAHTFRASLI